MPRVFNFSPGPACLPTAVLQRAADEMLDWHGSGMSIMEMSHRSSVFMDLIQKIEQDLRDLMQIPPEYAVLFLAGGASSHFAALAMNLCQDPRSADYVDTGVWSKKAIAEAKRFCQVNVVAQEICDATTYIPAQSQWQMNSDAAYLHYTPNETITGLAFPFVPESGNVPLVADMTSMILSESIPVNKFGMIYAGTQKNLGSTGLSVVVIRKNLLVETPQRVPSLMSYQLLANNNCLLNTPPTYSWYLTGLYLEWMKAEGGLPAFQHLNQQKSTALYEVIDAYPDFYRNKIRPDCRSAMNVTFDLPTKAVEQKFLLAAEQRSLVNLRGHRLVGGIRASIYNAMPLEGVLALVDFMQDFCAKEGGK
jgi:phosphoserine aminotransferase